MTEKSFPVGGLRLVTQLSVLFSLALAVRLIMLFRFPHVVFLHEADAMGYITIAKSVVTTGGLGGAVHFPPFFPAVIALFSLFTADWELAARLASAVMGALVVVPVYLVAARLAGWRVGLLAALSFVMLRDVVDFSLQPLSQTTYLTLLMLVTVLGMTAVSTCSSLVSLLLGLACSALYLTRPEGILAFAFVLALIVLARLLDRTAPLPDKIRSLLLLAAGFSLPTLPYLFYLRQQTGAWTISGKAGATIIGIDRSMKLLPDGTLLGQKAMPGAGIGSMLADIGLLLQTCRENGLKFLQMLPEHLPTPLLLTALAGVALLAFDALRREKRSEALLQLAMAFAGVIVVLPVFAFSNLSVAVSYILPIFPLLLIGLCRLAGGGEALLLGRLASGSSRLSVWIREIPVVSAAAVLMLGLLSLRPLWQELGSEDFKWFAKGQEFFLKETGSWLKQNTPANAAVMARWSQVGFYGDRRWTGLADGSIAEVVAYSKKQAIGYIVIDSVAVPRRRPQLAPLLDPSLGAAGLRAVYARDGYDIRVVIYQVL